MPLSPVEEIKSRLDVVDVVQGYLRLQKAGVNYRALCPFHNEKTPSFFVSPSRQSWHCFGCDSGGDIISFVEKIEGVEFREALKMLADRAGIRLAADNPQARSEREKILGVLEEAAKFYENELAVNAGKTAREYLEGRGLKSETMQTFRLGYAPDDWRRLLAHLTEIGYTPQDIEKAGLIIKKSDVNGQSSNVSYYDRFRHRIMFPLCDVNGKVIGFTGRVMPGADDSQGKYVNTPQTSVFDKGRLLYGLHLAKIQIRKFDYAILVEGQMDLLMSYQAGVENVVAVSGTALTSWHLNIIKRYTQRLECAFDMDAAGENATKRAIELAQQNGFAIKIIRLLYGKDAADLVKGNPAAWLEAIKNSVSLLDFYFTAALARHDAGTVEGKKSIANELLPVLKRIPHAVEQAHWLGVLAERLGVREADLRVELAKVKTSPVASTFSSSPPTPAPLPKTRKGLLVEECAVYLCRFPEYGELMKSVIAGPVVESIRQRASEPDVRVKSDFIDDAEESAREYFTLALQELAGLAVHEELFALQAQLREKEQFGKWEEMQGLVQTIRLVSERLKP